MTAYYVASTNSLVSIYFTFRAELNLRSSQAKRIVELESYLNDFKNAAREIEEHSCDRNGNTPADDFVATDIIDRAHTYVSTGRVLFDEPYLLQFPREPGYDQKKSIGTHPGAVEQTELLVYQKQDAFNEGIARYDR
jgi:hypothetical protein